MVMGTSHPQSAFSFQRKTGKIPPTSLLPKGKGTEIPNPALGCFGWGLQHDKGVLDSPVEPENDNIE
jgi:hypothetical protein